MYNINITNLLHIGICNLYDVIVGRSGKIERLVAVRRELKTDIITLRLPKSLGRRGERFPP